MSKLFRKMLGILLCLMVLVPVRANAATELAITKEPKSVKVLEGQTAKVTVEAQGDGLKYAWYYMKSGASSYTKSGNQTTNTLSLKMSAAWDDAKFYCVVTDKYGTSVMTSVVTLNMKLYNVDIPRARAHIAAHPEDFPRMDCAALGKAPRLSVGGYNNTFAMAARCCSPPDRS